MDTNKLINNIWYKKHLISYILLPLSLLFRLISACRRFWLLNLTPPEKLSVPVIVVGNINVGGTGKTPFVCWLYEFLTQQGFQAGIISRGYKSELAANQVKLVTNYSNALEVGDEAFLLHNKLNCPMVIGQNRLKAAKYLLEQFPKLDIIISDDGLQHYKLYRDIEIVLIDADRQFGNGFCLPAGPLREPVSRLHQADFVIINGAEKAKTSFNNYNMQVRFSETVFAVGSNHTKNLSNFANKQVNAIAAIGNPKKFFSMLNAVNVRTVNKCFIDHYQYEQQDLEFANNLPILMTEKDAVKCHGLDLKDAWYIPLSVSIDANFIPALLRRLDHGQKAA